MMTSDLTSIENELRKLAAAPLDDGLLARLEACAEGTDTELTPNELRFEASLRAMSPARLAPEMLAEFVAIAGDTPFAVDEKIVLFPGANRSVHAKPRRPIWAAAAAVALIGGASALLVPPASKPGLPIARQVETTPDLDTAPPSVTGAANRSMVPASFNRGVSQVSDEGVIWNNKAQPHTVVRVEYKDRITLKDRNGRTFQIEKPRVQYMLVPAKTD